MRFLPIWGPQRPTPFGELSQEQLDQYIERTWYGNFELTDAVRPAYYPDVPPSEGYRLRSYKNQETGRKIPMLMASVTRGKLLDLFQNLLDPLGCEVDVILETSHDASERGEDGHEDLYRMGIDLPVLQSTFYDFEDLLLNDGHTGVAVIGPHCSTEIQFDEDKLLSVYAENLSAFEKIFHSHGVRRNDAAHFINAGQHFHQSSDHYRGQFQELRVRLGLDGEEW